MEFSLPSISDQDKEDPRVRPKKTRIHQNGITDRVKMFLEKGEDNNQYLSPSLPNFVKKKDRSIKVLDNESDVSEMEKNFMVNF